MLRRLTSRINHSCRPNASYVFRPGGHKVSIRSLMRIPSGTEVHSHLLPLLPFRITVSPSRPVETVQVTTCLSALELAYSDMLPSMQPGSISAVQNSKLFHVTELLQPMVWGEKTVWCTGDHSVHGCAGSGACAARKPAPAVLL